ncbi:ankyrin repeat domain-containing protein SOWAHD-like isoform X4 [Sinocyclocheilus grahami]|uniref:ankyrin repeat domain-containing protein SOWAHD-like isoform X4 n=1 Tax=Sinocyclocheilus grahami TaxID=75366 RepID=UPI0007AC652A|nr:PREDICTED: ankyrin repeat domain-containing protein SOWAHD-like isoform X4 [Sinocyclocheilus grahami]
MFASVVRSSSATYMTLEFRTADSLWLLARLPTFHSFHPRTQFTALHWAAKHGKEDMTNMLAEAGADINIKALQAQSKAISLNYQGYTPLHIAALHGHRHIYDLLVRTYGAKDNLRDYSGHLAYHYLNVRETQLEDHELSEVSECHSLTQAGERRNRKITSLFHSMKKWGSAEDLAPVPEERTVAHQLMLPAFRPRKFSR